MRYNYIAIEGNIGAGKTCLSSMIAEQFNGKLILEQFEDNSFLPTIQDGALRGCSTVSLPQSAAKQ